jgi:hypothetical protein
VTEAAVRRGFETFVDETIAATRGAFDVAAAVDGVGGRLADRLLSASGRLERRVVRPELRAYRDRVLDQFDAILAYAAGDEPFAAHEATIRDRDPYLASLRPGLPADRREAVAADVLARGRRLGDAVAPLVAEPADGFWVAVTAAYPEDRARELVREQFAFTGPFADHRGAFRFETRVDAGDVLDAGPLGAALPTVTVRYTDEAIRAMRRAESRVVSDTLDRLAAAYADAGGDRGGGSGVDGDPNGGDGGSAPGAGSPD